MKLHKEEIQIKLICATTFLLVSDIVSADCVCSLNTYLRLILNACVETMLSDRLLLASALLLSQLIKAPTDTPDSPTESMSSKIFSGSSKIIPVSQDPSSSGHNPPLLSSSVASLSNTASSSSPSTFFSKPVPSGRPPSGNPRGGTLRSATG